MIQETSEPPPRRGNLIAQGVSEFLEMNPRDPEAERAKWIKINLEKKRLREHAEQRGKPNHPGQMALDPIPHLQTEVLGLPANLTDFVGSQTRTLAATPAGDRNNTLNTVAFLLGRCYEHGLEEDVARDLCVEACSDNGLYYEPGGVEEVLNTFQSGWNAGVKNGPLTLLPRISNLQLHQALTFARYMKNNFPEDFDVWIGHNENLEQYRPSPGLRTAMTTEFPLKVTSSAGRKLLQRAMEYIEREDTLHAYRCYDLYQKITNQVKIRRSDQRANFEKYVSAMCARLAIEGRDEIIFAYDSANEMIANRSAEGQNTGPMALDPIPRLREEVGEALHHDTIHKILVILAKQPELQITFGKRNEYRRATHIKATLGTGQPTATSETVRAWLGSYSVSYEKVQEREAEAARRNEDARQTVKKNLETLEDDLKIDVIEREEKATAETLHDFRQILNQPCPQGCEYCQRHSEARTYLEDLLGRRS